MHLDKYIIHNIFLNDLLNSAASRPFSPAAVLTGNCIKMQVYSVCRNLSSEPTDNIKTLYDLNGTEPWLVSLKTLLLTQLFLAVTKVCWLFSVVSPQKKPNHTHTQTQWLGPFCLSSSSFLLCWCPALNSHYYFFHHQLSLHSSRWASFVSGKNWNQREGLLDDTAPTRCSLGSNNGTSRLTNTSYVCNLITAFMSDLKYDKLGCLLHRLCNHWPSGKADFGWWTRNFQKDI